MKVEAKKQATPVARLLRLVPGFGKRTQPSLELSAAKGRVKATASIPVEVSFAGVDRVELELEPKNTFALDTASLEESGIVRLLGKRDGKATLIATGVRSGVDVIQRLVHVECDGPIVRILSFGYTPGGTRRG
jgi:hypothetical protein